MNRKPEDLPITQDVGSSWTESLAPGMKNGIPGDLVPGDFLRLPSPFLSSDLPAEFIVLVLLQLAL
ncbi:MAG: hypothetical protein ACP5VS_00320 [Desulfomonilaceae bacterium]